MKTKSNLNPVLAALATLALVGSIQALAGSPTEKHRDRIRVMAWSKDAKLSRRLSEAALAKIRAARKKGDKRPIPVYAAMAGVKAGSLLEVPDVLETRSGDATIMGGTLTVTRLKPNTTLKYVKVNPTRLVPSTPAEMVMSLEKGTAQMRIGTLAQPSSVQLINGMTFTGAKGTAYSVTVKGTRLTLVVAEGTVEMGLTLTPGDAVAVGPRQKLSFDSATSEPFPQAPVPIGPADEATIREVLSLPVGDLNGYESGRDIRRSDAEDIVVTRVEQILRHYDSDSFFSYKPRWGAGERLYFTGRDDFWTTDGAGKRKNVGRGYLFEALAPDGAFLIASRPNRGLWRMDWDGSGLRQISRSPLGAVKISPNGKRLLAASGWYLQSLKRWDGKAKKMVATKEKRWLTTGKKWVALPSIGGHERILTRNGDGTEYADPIWKRAGDRLIVRLGTSRRGFTYVDGDADPAIVLAKEETSPPGTNPGGMPGNRIRWRVSPMGRWLYGPTNEGEMVFVRLSDRKRFVHKGPEMSVLLGERTAEGGGQVFEIENPNVPGRTRTESDRDYPVRFGLDVSPNGEILAYGSRGPVEEEAGPNLASFADSLDPSRYTETAVSVTQYLDEIHWLNGYRVLFRSPNWDSTRTIIVTLGVKRRSASNAPKANAEPKAPVPTVYFPGPVDASALEATEFVVTDVSPKGTITGFTKLNSHTQGNQDFVVRAGSRKAATLPMGLTYPERVYDDGLVLSRELGSYPDGKMVASGLLNARVKAVVGSRVILEQSEEDPNAVADKNGYKAPRTRYFVWNPRTKDKPTELTPPESGATLFGAISDGTAGWVSRDGADRRRVWLGKIGETPRLTGYKARYMDPTLGEDGRLYITGGEGRNNRMKNWADRLTEDGKHVELFSIEYGYDAPKKDQKYPSLSGATQDGIVYGADFGPDFEFGATGQWQVAQEAWVVYKDRKIPMRDLLGEGYTMTQFRRITPEGRVCGSIYFQGKPVIAAPSIYDLLKRWSGS